MKNEGGKVNGGDRRDRSGGEVEVEESETRGMKRG